ncbi:MAG: extracellular solute-binding protein [Clostridia bacterium]|nr:extracellular solute-binding protein [Clostridia bacterium]
MTKRIFALMLTAFMLFSTVACGKKAVDRENSGLEPDMGITEPDSVDTGTAQTTNSALADFIDNFVPVTEDESSWNPEDPPDFGGHEFKFLNSSPIHSMYVYLAPDATGDFMDESCVLRNVIAQEKFNIRIIEETQPFEELASYAQTLIQSGDQVYDAMYIGCTDLTPLISENLFVDLLEVPLLNIDKVWWDQQFIQRNIVEDQLFYTTSDLNLMAFDSVWAMYFNEDMMQDLGLEFPYELVLDGKWTMEELNKYAKAAADLNGDSSFEYDASGLATYGEVSVAGIENQRLYSLGAEYVERNYMGRYEFTAHENENFWDAWVALSTYFGTIDGRFLYGGEDDFLEIFANRRALFLSAELKYAPIICDTKNAFGLLPQPKYDEEQDSYESSVGGNVLSFCIPATNKELARTGLIVDYLTYESYRSILPRYYDTHTGYKALTRDESCQCLEIIRNTKGLEVSVPFGWTRELSDELCSLAREGRTEIASTIETYQDACIAAIDKTYAEYPTHGKQG